MSDLREETQRELANLQDKLGSMMQGFDDDLPPAFVSLFLERLNFLIVRARDVLSLLDREDVGDFVEYFGAMLESVESELKPRQGQLADSASD